MIAQRVGGTLLGGRPPACVESTAQAPLPSRVSTPATSPDMPTLVPVSARSGYPSSQVSPVIPQASSTFTSTPVLTPVTARIVERPAFSSLNENSPRAGGNENPFLATLNSPGSNNRRPSDSKNSLEAFPDKEQVHHRLQRAEPKVARPDRSPGLSGYLASAAPSPFFFLGSR
eukprot:gnl/MRDRNA2_/MRDRNA2_260500_c0_seq1.p1 gnl/MRDRNA2_/MRDRNA2_260500_c0~~gnl/MRDRNA2_/MRDRNA2_260500_c0_seq1.p1  ORF type:complete len:173 (+),score=25.94 gnl/MRDRNA2_/MRDRNA2_260500_c0_seq1:1-519(+)